MSNATPTGTLVRQTVYLAQTGRKAMTPRQARRAAKKREAAMAKLLRGLSPTPKCPECRVTNGHRMDCGRRGSEVG